MKPPASTCLLAAFGCVLSLGHVLAAEPAEGVAASIVVGPLPVTLTLDKPGYVTALIERADGRRVCNLASEVKASAGTLTLNWDLYDIGVRKVEKEPYTRTLVEPGTYRVRGLVHDGLDLRVEFKKLGKQDWHEDKTVIPGDLGIIRSNGAQNVQRVCWNSLDTWMTSGIPREARWRSLNWGVLKLGELVAASAVPEV